MKRPALLVALSTKTWQRFGLSIRKNCRIIFVVSINNIPCWLSSALLFFKVWNYFLSFALLTSLVHNLDSLWIEMVPMNLIARLKWQCQKNQCHLKVSVRVFIDFLKCFNSELSTVIFLPPSFLFSFELGWNKT